MKASSGPRYVVQCQNKVDKDKLTTSTRIFLYMTTLTIMRALPHELSSIRISHQQVVNKNKLYQNL